MRTLLLSCLLIFNFSFAPPKKVDFKFQLEADKTYSQSMTINGKTKQTMMGQAREIDSKVTNTTNFKLKNTDEGSNVYTVWYSHIGIESAETGNTQTISSDTSSLEVVDPFSATLAQVVDKEFEARISEKGEVTELLGLEEMIAEITGGSEEEPNEMSAVLSSGFGDSGFRNNVEGVTHIFPDKPVNVGDTWSRDQNSNTGFPLVIKNTYTLKSVTGDLAVIDVKGPVSVNPEQERAEMGGMEVLYFIEGERTGTLTVDINTGWVVEATFTDDIGGSLTISPNPQVPEGMTIPLAMKNVTTINGK